MKMRSSVHQFISSSVHQFIQFFGSSVLRFIALHASRLTPHASPFTLLIPPFSLTSRGRRESMFVNFKIIYGLILLGLLSSCLPELSPDYVSLIHTGPGPEDLVHDAFEGRNRLLISCNDRIDDGTYGAIETYALGSDDTSSVPLPLVDYPVDKPFNPHGLDIIEREGNVYLYVINHYEDVEDQSSVLLFEVEASHLRFIKEFGDGLITTPNAVTAATNGGLLCDE